MAQLHCFYCLFLLYFLAFCEQPLIFLKMKQIECHVECYKAYVVPVSSDNPNFFENK